MQKLKITIKDKVALAFSGITTLILFIIFAYLYIHALRYEQREFHKSLKMRAEIAAQSYFKKDELNRDLYQKIVDEHLHSLQDEQEFIARLDSLDNIRQKPEYFDEEFLQEVREEGIAFRSLEHGKSAIWMLYEGNEGVFLVMLSAYNIYENRNISDLRNTMITLLLVYMVMVYLIGRAFASQILAPLDRIVEEMRTIDSENLQTRLRQPVARDEIWELTHNFNDLLDRIDTTLRTQQNFISNASHELKNPLTAILGEIDVTLQKDRSPGEYRQSMEVIEYEAGRLRKLTLRLLHLAETSYTDRKPQMTEVRVDELIYELVAEYNSLHPERKFTLELMDLPEDVDILGVKGSPVLLRIALTNLLDNAIKFSDDQIDVRLCKREKRLSITITDFGIGIPEEDIKNLYIPFFRSSNARIVPGFGIGLPLVKRILDMHKAELLVRSEEGRYTSFTVVFGKQAGS